MLQLQKKARQVRKQKLGLLFRPARRRMAKQNHGWERLGTQGDDGAEIRIGRHDHTILRGGGFKNDFIGRSLQITVANVNRIMACGLQKLS